jgi:nitrite reductase/ring-hydroxylating ferredoxin subunit
MLQFDPQVLKYLPADRLAEHLKQLHPGMAVTHGRHESLVPGYPVGSVHRVTRGPIELLLRRKDEDQVEVWPSLCPHEGGLMDKKHLCDSQLVCPWHGLRFAAVVLGNGGRDSWRYLQVTVRYKGDHLEVAPLASNAGGTPTPDIPTTSGRLVVN